MKIKTIIILLLNILCFNQVFAEDQIQVSNRNNGTFSSILMLMAFFIIFYFLLIRPQMKRNKEQRLMISKMKQNDELMTTGGLMGKIVKIRENDLDLEITHNVIVTIHKNYISTILPKGSIKKNNYDKSTNK